jgi:hypothetical protein
MCSNLLSELCSSHGSSVSILNEHDKLTYGWVKAAYSCPLSEICHCLEVREIKVVNYSSIFVLWGTASKIKSNNGSSTVISMSYKI